MCILREPTCIRPNTHAQYGHRAGPEECQEFMNQLGPEWGGGVAFTFKLKVQDMVIGEVLVTDMTPSRHSFQ